jgi:hypothetical protein
MLNVGISVTAPDSQISKSPNLQINCYYDFFGKTNNFSSLYYEACFKPIILLTINLTTMSKMLTAYCMKTKEKNVPMQDAVITKTARGGYMAQGHDGKGNKMTTMLGEATALEAVKNGVAKKAW